MKTKYIAKKKPIKKNNNLKNYNNNMLASIDSKVNMKLKKVSNNIE